MGYTAVIIEYDDSDGWYDHAMPPIVSQSDDVVTDALLGKACAVSLLQKRTETVVDMDPVCHS